MDIDFAWLTEIDGNTAKKQAPETPHKAISRGGEYKTKPKEKNATEGQIVPLDGMRRLQRRKEEEKADYDRCLQIYKEYQANITACSQLQADITKAVRAGADPFLLFLKAVEALSKITNNMIFYDQVKNDLLSVYGDGLLYSTPLEWKLEAAKDRLGRLKQALEREGSLEDKNRIQGAIKAHQEEIGRLQQNLEKANEW